MKTKSLVELIESVDTSYLTEQERVEAIARTQAAEYFAELVVSAMSWVKNKLVGKRTPFNPAKHYHA
ncbi:hypothetical protein [Marinomonas atlantica]|uniref:hypothetical protein n=1 Tax=Marinomonas atlantica TaxID=1806668 RepID=UPI00082D8404|nr:hypothetical protein [Marinomonas atlantica]